MDYILLVSINTLIFSVSSRDKKPRWQFKWCMKITFQFFSGELRLFFSFNKEQNILTFGQCYISNSVVCLNALKKYIVKTLLLQWSTFVFLKHLLLDVYCVTNKNFLFEYNLEKNVNVSRNVKHIYFPINLKSKHFYLLLLWKETCLPMPFKIIIVTLCLWEIFFESFKSTA